MDTLVLGIIVGLTYGILGLGLTLIYKSARFVNFAHGNLGVVSAVLFDKAVVDWGVPYWVALPVALAFGGALGVPGRRGALMGTVLMVSLRRLRSTAGLPSGPAECEGSA